MYTWDSSKDATRDIVGLPFDPVQINLHMIGDKIQHKSSVATDPQIDLECFSCLIGTSGTNITRLMGPVVASACVCVCVCSQ